MTEQPSEPQPGTAVAGVIPAAGASVRLGANKLLLELEGEPLIRRCARMALASGLAPVIVVLGHEAGLVAAAVGGLPVTPVENPAAASGMPSSLRVGITAVPAHCEAALVLLPDMPLVTAALVAEVLARYRADRPPLVTALYGSTAAPPTLYDRSLFPALLAAQDGGRQVVREHRAEAALVRCPAGLLADLDRPEDLERLGVAPPAKPAPPGSRRGERHP